MILIKTPGPGGSLQLRAARSKHQAPNQGTRTTNAPTQALNIAPARRDPSEASDAHVAYTNGSR